MNYGGSYMTPGMGTEYFTQEQQIWFGREEQQLWFGRPVDSSTVDSGNTSYTSILRPGLALGIITATGKLTAWNPYATNGSQRLFGFMGGTQQMNFMGAAAERILGYILVKGNVYASRLLIPGETTYGLAGKTYEFLLRQQMEGRYLVDDNIEDGLMNWKVLEKAFTSGDDTLTLTRADNRTIVSNRGADAAGTVVLPAPKPGMEFAVEVVADHHVTVDAPATGEFFLSSAAPTADSDQFDEDNKEYVYIRAIRTGASTYQYKLDASKIPEAVA